MLSNIVLNSKDLNLCIIWALWVLMGDREKKFLRCCFKIPDEELFSQEGQKITTPGVENNYLGSQDGARSRETFVGRDGWK